ncbi:MAG: glycoside hydrolase family 65 protein [Myxococcota bacterium]
MSRASSGTSSFLSGDEDLVFAPWSIAYHAYRPERQRHRETLCALGNGVYVTRGAAEEERAGGPHYPGVYMHGGYNRLESHIEGQIIEHEDLVNWPNWLPLSFRAEGEEWFRLDEVTLLGFEQVLDLRGGILTRTLHFHDNRERQTRLISRRLVHMRHPHLAVQHWELTPLNWSGHLEIRSGLDGTVSNEGVERYRALNGHHLEDFRSGRIGEDAIFLTARTSQSDILLAEAARTRIFSGDGPAAAQRTSRLEGPRAAQHIELECERDKPLLIEKVVALHSSRDFAIADALTAAADEVRHAPSMERLVESHRQSWRELWRRADIEIKIPEASAATQAALRLHIFHLLQTASHNTVGIDAGVPARGLHGEAYRGHVFWDELFIFPFLTSRMPELTSSLLLYRFRRRHGAQRLAIAQRCTGASYPWQSGSDGREESQRLHQNPLSKRWVPDDTHRQRHVSGAVAYNAWKYFEATGDIEFLSTYGTEILIDVAKYWASAARYNPTRQQYELHGVVGPDEYHTKSTPKGGPGLSNNSYTNILASWCLQKASEALRRISPERKQELCDSLGIDDDEVQRWERMSTRFYLPFQNDGLLLPFEGWERLTPFPWARYQVARGNLQRLDRILESEGDDINRYQASKQPDVLMLFFLFSFEELRQLFSHLGYAFEHTHLVQNIEYYTARCTHGSTLSRVVEAWVHARVNREEAWQLFREALRSDLCDVQGGTTGEGIHLGAMAGTVDLLQRCFTGIEVRDDVLWIDPYLPLELQSLQFRYRYRGHWLTLRFTHDEALIQLDEGWPRAVKVGVCSEVYEMAQGETHRIPLCRSTVAKSPGGSPGPP